MDMQTSTLPPVVLKNVPGFQIPRLVAHRGYAAVYPENTLLALNEALKYGACYIEFDVQFTSDGVPVLFHDATLKRTTGLEGRIMDFPYAEVRTFQACEPERFGHTFLNAGIGIPSLADAIYLLKNWPQARAFVEVKVESLEKLGIEHAMRTLVKTLRPALSQCTVISYNDLAIRCARAMGARSIGWVIETWNADSRSSATNLTPDFLFCNYRKVPFATETLWRGPWKWALYEVTDPDQALELALNGADLIETMEIGDMMQHPVLRHGGCFDGCLI